MEQIAQEFLRAVRGTRSQVAFARRLGYRANPITDWENGRRFPTAREALRACRRSGIEVAAAVARFAPHDTPLENPSPEVLAAWLNGLRGTRSLQELARVTERSRFSISRWLSGESQPRLPDFFRLIDAMTGRLPDFVAEIVPIANVPSLRERYETALAARTVAFEEPWTEAVLRLIETEAYVALGRHDDEWIARVLGISKETEQRCVTLLLRAGILRAVKDKYAVIGSLTVDTRAPEATARLLSHWASVGAEHARDPREGDVYAYNVLSASREDLARIRQVMRTAFREIRSIVATSEPSETAAFIGMQIVRWEPEVPAEG